MNRSKTAARLGVVAAMVAATALSGAAGASAHSHHHHGEIKGEVSNNRGHDIGIKTIVRLFERTTPGQGTEGVNHDFRLVAQVFTNRHGDFKFKHLDSGTYYLEALGNAGQSPLSDAGTYRSEFYQNSRTIEHASRIRLHHDQTKHLDEIKLTRN
jgi:ABC-type glycerol-3-phosphate transport system substrate-binding protein